MDYALYCVLNFTMYIISLDLSLYVSYKCSMLRGKKNTSHLVGATTFLYIFHSTLAMI